MNNKYYILRHGESLLNKKEILCCWPEKIYCPLTPKGRKQIKAQSEKLKTAKRAPKINLIFSSDLLRTRQTAEIVSKELGIKPKYDKRLREYNVGIFNGRTRAELREFFGKEEKRFKVKPPGGENYVELKKRMSDFLKEMERKYSNKNILIISHQAALNLLEGKVKGLSNQEILKNFPKEKRIKVGELRVLTE